MSLGFGKSSATGSFDSIRHFDSIRRCDRDWESLCEGVFSDAEKVKIGILGISRGAGATFIASRIAYELSQESEGVCFVEAGGGEVLAIHSLAMARTFKKERFCDYFASWEEGLGAGSRRNIFENINWVLRSPYGRKTEDAGESPCIENPITDFELFRRKNPRIQAKFSRIPYEQIPGRYMVIDSPPSESLKEMDLLICVVDPLPSAVIAGEELIRTIRENRIRTGRRLAPAMNNPTPCLWVLNKDNPKVRHRQLEKFMRIKFDFVIPMIDPAEFYRAEYAGMPIFKAIERPGGDEKNGRSAAVSETAAIAQRIRKLLPIL